MTIACDHQNARIMSRLKFPILNKSNGLWYVLLAIVFGATVVLILRDHDVRGEWSIEHVESSPMQR